MTESAMCEAKITIKETEVYKEYDIMLEGEVIGTAEIKYPDMTLNNFFIYPQYRNRGFGKSAIKKFITDYGVTNLWVSADNEIAKHIYEVNGFRVDDNPNYIAMRLKGGAE